MADYEEQIIEELKVALRQTAESASDHRGRTKACPRTWDIAEGVAKGWIEPFRSHVRGCQFCKKVSAMQWNIGPPDESAVWRHLADDTLPDDATLRCFLDEDRYQQY